MNRRVTRITVVKRESPAPVHENENEGARQ